MEQHPIPRQITSFEFKLIGFMTLRQFLYLLVSVPSGFVIFKLFPIPLINIILGLIVAGFGAALAFLPINDRPMDVWIKNLVKRLNSPTQFTYHKENSPLYFLEDLFFVSDPHKVVSHVESKQKLAEYLEKTQPRKPSNAKKNQINSLLKAPTAQIRPQAVVMPKNITVRNTVTPPISSAVQSAPVANVANLPATIQSIPTEPIVTHTQPAISTPAASQPQTRSMQHPFLTGVIKNNRQIPLPGVLVYIKQGQSSPLRLLKTNTHGIFATFSPLPDGDYQFEIKDPNGGYFFDTMNVHVAGATQKPYEFFSQAS